MKIKVGDKVKIREDLKKETSYGGLWVADHMEKILWKKLEPLQICMTIRVFVLILVGCPVGGTRRW